MIDLLSRTFAGNYLFERQVSSSNITMKGIARFTAISHKLIHYYEEGSYTEEQYEGMFYQTRFFSFQKKHLFILKNDKKLLHQFDLIQESTYPLHLTHTHECKKDFYKLDLWIESKNKLSTFYLVSGSRKKYSIKTIYTKIT